MITLRNWTARRSGASITIKGTAESGETIVIANVSEITAGEDFPLARTADGATYQLGRYRFPKPSLQASA